MYERFQLYTRKDGGWLPAREIFLAERIREFQCFPLFR